MRGNFSVKALLFVHFTEERSDARWLNLLYFWGQSLTASPRCGAAQGLKGQEVRGSVHGPCSRLARYQFFEGSNMFFFSNLQFVRHLSMEGEIPPCSPAFCVWGAPGGSGLSPWGGAGGRGGAAGWAGARPAPQRRSGLAAHTAGMERRRWVHLLSFSACVFRFLAAAARGGEASSTRLPPVGWRGRGGATRRC